MSRLIDADKLTRHGNRGGIVHWKDIENAPTIEPRHGEWKHVWKQVQSVMFNGMECSVCGESIYQDTFWEYDFNYCPSCGSRNKE